MSIEAMKLALEALDMVKTNADDWQERTGKQIKGWMQPVNNSITALRQAIEQAQKQEPVAKGKLKVTLQDTPTDIELAQYKRMFEAACSALGAIGEALGVDEDEGGAEPILAAIEELKTSPSQRQLEQAQKQEPVGYFSINDYGNWEQNESQYGTPFYEHPPQRQPLLDEMRKQMKESCDTHEMRGAFADGWLSAEAAHGIKGEQK
jgi:hypothetical protein